MKNPFQLFDICIICALPEEARALLEVLQPLCVDTIKEGMRPCYNYRFATFNNADDGPLNLHISWPPRYGPREMLLHLPLVLQECQPRIAIMAGMCAGDVEQVKLGNLVVAERIYTYDNGTFKLDDAGRMVHDAEALTGQLDANILQFLGLFDGWKPLVAGLKRPSFVPAKRRMRKRWQAKIEIGLDGSAFEGSPNFITAFPLIWNVPYRHKEYFTNREQVLLRIHKAFKQTSPGCRIVTLGGAAGMGKTQTAAEYAYLYYADYRYVLWINAESATTLISDFAMVAELLHLTTHDGRDAVARVMEWLGTHGQWLLIFDNANDLTIVSDCIPKVCRGHILLTTRAQAVEDLGESVHLEKFSAEVGAVFLLHRATTIDTTDTYYEAVTELKVRTEEKYTIARTISERLGGLPLALDQAGAYIENTGCSLLHYLLLYQKHSADLQKLKYGSVPEYPEVVAITGAFLRTLVQKHNPVAADLLRVCAFLYPEAISEVIFTAGAAELGPLLAPIANDTMKLDLAIRELRKYALITHNAETETLSMHRLLQDVQRAELSQREQRMWAVRVVKAVYKTIQRPEAFPLHHVHNLRVQAQACALLIKRWKMRFSEARKLETWIEEQP